MSSSCPSSHSSVFLHVGSLQPSNRSVANLKRRLSRTQDSAVLSSIENIPFLRVYKYHCLDHSKLTGLHLPTILLSNLPLISKNVSCFLAGHIQSSQCWPKSAWCTSIEKATIYLIFLIFINSYTVQDLLEPISFPQKEATEKSIRKSRK